MIEENETIRIKRFMGKNKVIGFYLNLNHFVWFIFGVMIIGCIDHHSIELFSRNLIKYVAVQNRNILLNMQGNIKVDILSVKN